ncbi:MAG: (Fe-S)-binding protein [Candidatus Latescibacteria bacterium]|nr:(Fe-S)-binding protein [Candidatus Latescibacterota bacterium]
MNDNGLNLLENLDYSVVQQCMHCGMCLPACPTYDATLLERSSPRGRIAMMRAIADGDLQASKVFAEEMYFCLGCLACQTACPAGVDYATLFENARAEVERQGLLNSPVRDFVRRWTLGWLFAKRSRLHRLGRSLRFFQRSGLQTLVRKSGLLRLMPWGLGALEPLTPEINERFTDQLYRQDLKKKNPSAAKYQVALLAGCIQDIAFAEVNADTICALQHNHCEVLLPEAQECCGSLHGHNGELDTAKRLARINIDAFNAEDLDAVIVNSGGCGSHIKHYEHLLADDAEYAERAKEWSRKVRDIHEFLVEIELRTPECKLPAQQVTYHESCHLKHGQKVSDAPREVLRAVPGLQLIELTEADWCCGSAGIYNITQPEMSMQLLDRKMSHVRATGAKIVATGNPGCAIQIAHGGQRADVPVQVVHPVSLLAAAYRAEKQGES